MNCDLTNILACLDTVYISVNYLLNYCQPQPKLKAIVPRHYAVRIQSSVTGELFNHKHFYHNMAYPKPVPAFTQEAFNETMERVEESTVPEEEVAAVAELRAEMQADSEE